MFPRSGLVSVLLMVLQWSGPGLASPLRPICDPRVLDRFIKEARDMESAVRSCKEGCGMVESLTVPLTSVDFSLWEKTEVGERSREVQAGLWLLAQALRRARASISDAALCGLVDTCISNIHSIGQVIRSHSIEQDMPPPTAASASGTQTWQVTSLAELLRIHTNFLRGKVRLLLSDAPACQSS
ncbi:erythropoietin-like [Megalops cyprinoides]|uniref:erythropoietin-like n=1 Tax=Megalops cyprinoides TaxID=118141 RepID=UPI001863ACEB|nr:erythropoietin-like [Megalops cyprinoides]